EAKYPGIAVKVERNPAEKLYQRLMMEYDSGIHAADVLESPDPVHLREWKRRGMLAAYVPSELIKYPAQRPDQAGYSANDQMSLVIFGVNAKLVKPEDAPTSYADMLDTKWKGKIVKGHPVYNGAGMIETFVVSRLLGWDYFQKLARQRVMSVQSSTEP